MRLRCDSAERRVNMSTHRRRRRSPCASVDGEASPRAMPGTVLAWLFPAHGHRPSRGSCTDLRVNAAWYSALLGLEHHASSLSRTRSLASLCRWRRPRLDLLVGRLLVGADALKTADELRCDPRPTVCGRFAWSATGNTLGSFRGIVIGRRSDAHGPLRRLAMPIGSGDRRRGRGCRQRLHRCGR